MSPFRTIVVAVDFSLSSDEALRTAFAIARDYGSRVHVLHVVAEPLQQPWTIEAAGVDFEEVRTRWRDEAERQLAGITPPAELAGKVVRAVAVGWPPTEIVRYAREHAVDLIVMGTHGYGPVKRFLLGSVADRTLRESHCPVLLVPHPTLHEPRPDRAEHAAAAR
jgi:nucleotide-binding universal stress UspA family protein